MYRSNRGMPRKSPLDRLSKAAFLSFVGLTQATLHSAAVAFSKEARKSCCDAVTEPIKRYLFEATRGLRSKFLTARATVLRVVDDQAPQSLKIVACLASTSNPRKSSRALASVSEPACLSHAVAGGNSQVHKWSVDDGSPAKSLGFLGLEIVHHVDFGLS